MNLDIGAIFFATLVGGVFGGIGGYLGFLIGKRFPAHAKLITQACSLAGVAVALVSTDAIKSAVFGQPFRAAIASDLDAEFQRLPMLQFLKNEWPSEYREFLNQLGGIKHQAEADQLATNFTTSLRRANAGYVKAADDAALADVLAKGLMLSRAVRQREGDDACKAMTVGGLTAIRDKADRFVAEAQTAGLATFKALQNGRKRALDGSASPAPPLTNADLEAFDLFVVDRGGKPGLRERVATPDNPELCDDGIAFFEALVEFERDTIRGRAFRVAVVYGMTVS